MTKRKLTSLVPIFIVIIIVIAIGAFLYDRETAETTMNNDEPMNENNIESEIVEEVDTQEEQIEEADNQNEQVEEVEEPTYNVLAPLPGASADYDISLTLDDQGVFHISSTIDVENLSDDVWHDVAFYLVPNAFIEENKPEFIEGKAEVSILSVDQNGQEATYDLHNNNLFIQLNEEINSGLTSTISIDYTLEIPEKGLRLSQKNGNYYLAHWYPMIAHYQEGWNIENYMARGESYHTPYGNYTISYKLPKEYFVVSSAPDGEAIPSTSGTLHGEKIKDFYIGILEPNEWLTTSIKVNDTNLRLFVPVDADDLLQEGMKEAEKGFNYFEKNIGDYPFEELDLIGNDGGMEYPNVVEVSDALREQSLHTIIHEIAHQWFYYLVTNDPYHDAWLDEGMTEFATTVYFYEQTKDEDISFEFAKRVSSLNETEDKVNISLDEFTNSYTGTLYGKVPLELWAFFQTNGGYEEAVKFLSAYYTEFQYEYVTTTKFVSFFNAYFQKDYSDFLANWLEF
ncbi:M1 family metallopeptidase [Cytobacillus sp. IB215665]|uniref:M1 family metallopeptidase n=1 Tax=Cytobacillus sp. IB215665 TaxID=3097357 RepID=UPI002A0BA686|nr:M1 family metallopeptidase [Cytobacillus sp. IB215665]MDX8365196.1 M1 family metallopeptidase [Cytobacillus sp. IB215665]